MSVIHKNLLYIFPACLGILLTAQICTAALGIKLTTNSQSSPVTIDLYKEGSFALLIGISDYTAGWPDLEAIPRELDKVEEELKRHGFSTTRINDPDSKALKRAFEDFINTYGFSENNRLLIFFSGHGHTRKNKGYIVPADAPGQRLAKPSQDEISELYDNGIRLHQHPGNHIIKVTHTEFWASEKRDAEAAAFTFGTGFPYWSDR